MLVESVIIRNSKHNVVKGQDQVKVQSEFEWWFYAQSASEAIFRAVKAYVIAYKIILMIT